MIIDAIFTYRFVKLLATPFSRWPACRLGIIDEHGRVLRKKRTLRKQEERDAWTLFDVLVANVKKLIARVPGGGFTATAILAGLLKEEELHDSLEGLLEDGGPPTNNSSSGQVAAIASPTKTSNGLKRAKKILRRKPPCLG